MRDYKNVKAPKKYRAETGRVSVKRVEAGRSRQRQRKHIPGIGNLLVNVAAMAAVTACCWLGWQAYRFTTTAELFRISGVDVAGVRELGRADLQSIAAEFTGQNIFRVDLDAAVRRILANPWIKDARIRRSLPNRIAITVEERTPCAVIETPSGRYLIDGEGVVIDCLGREDAAGHPYPVIVSDYRPSPGEAATAESITDALTLLAEIKARGGWNPADVRIKAGSPEALAVVYGGHEFRVGSGNYPEKLRRLTEVMADVKQRGLAIAYVDLRPDRQAAVMVKEKKDAGNIPNNRRQGGKKRQ